MKRSDDGGETLSPERKAAVSDREPSRRREDRPAGKTARSLPSVSFMLFALAVITAGAGTVTWALVRPEPRTVEILIPTPGPMVVHVTGSVSSPGVYILPPGSRVAEAVDAAGGLTGPSSINLAALLRDGQQLVVTGAAATTDGELVSPITGLNGQAGNLLLDLNTASAIQLEQLPGIGPTRAAAIIAFRERNGPVLFADDLTAIDGIGPATVDGIRPLVIQP